MANATLAAAPVVSSPVPATIPAVSCIRMSSDKQEDSPDQQRDEVAKLAAKYGCTIEREFIDEGISGVDTRKRRGFQDMLAYVQQSKTPKVILSWDQDRFSRLDSIDSGEIIAPLRRAGVRLITVAQGEVDWNSFAGRMMFGITQEAKNQFLRDLSRNALRGMSAAAKAGVPMGVPYGYKRENGKMVIDPAKAAIVRRIFAEYNAGKSTRAIAIGLNADGVPTARGSVSWQGGVVAEILKRRAYVGDYFWGQKQRGKFHTAEPVYIADKHEAIVDRETFDLAQARLTRNQRQTSPHNRNGGGYLLTGLIRCGCCGSPMVGHMQDGYICAGYKSEGKAKCSCNHIKQAPLVAAIVEKIQQELLAPEILDDLRAELRKQLEAKPVGDPGKLAKRLADAERKVNAAADNILIAPAGLAGTLYSRLEKLQAERDSLRAQLDAAQRPETADDGQDLQGAEAAIEALRQLSDTIKEAEGYELRQLLQASVERVELFFKPGAPRQTFSSGVIHFKVPSILTEQVPLSP